MNAIRIDWRILCAASEWCHVFGMKRKIVAILMPCRERTSSTVEWKLRLTAWKKWKHLNKQRGSDKTIIGKDLPGDFHVSFFESLLKQNIRRVNKMKEIFGGFSKFPLFVLNRFQKMTKKEENVGKMVKKEKWNQTGFETKRGFRRHLTFWKGLGWKKGSLKIWLHLFKHFFHFLLQKCLLTRTLLLRISQWKLYFDELFCHNHWLPH